MPENRLAATNVWLWMFQRITAVVLVIVLVLHLWLANFAQSSASSRAILGVVTGASNVSKGNEETKEKQHV